MAVSDDTRDCGVDWWLRSPGKSQNNAVFISSRSPNLMGTEENLKAQGRFCYRGNAEGVFEVTLTLINGIFERVDAGTIKMDALTFWGITDGMSWRKEYKPLLFDSILNPKYALYGVFQLKDFI